MLSPVGCRLYGSILINLFILVLLCGRIFCPHFIFIFYWRCFIISKQDIQINEEIRDDECKYKHEHDTYLSEADLRNTEKNNGQYHDTKNDTDIKCQHDSCCQKKETDQLCQSGEPVNKGIQLTV